MKGYMSLYLLYVVVAKITKDHNPTLTLKA